MAGRCVFCDLDPARLSWASELVVALRDAYPVSPGHTLILPRRHVPTWFDASAEERRALWEGVEAVKEALDREFHPDGYNVGFNAGEAAGQTVMHLHVHVIPRYHGDVDDPRGGVRGVIPGRQKYDPFQPPQEDADPFAGLDAFVPGEDDGHLLPAILRAMRVADEIDIVAAFIQETGVRLLEGDLVDALVRQAKIRILTGDYLGITHPHALQRLYTLTTDHPGLQVRLYRVAKDQSFHPKAYIFLRDPHGAAFVGSSNLSRSALTSGVEWNLRSTHRDAATFRAIRRRFDRLFHAHPQSVELTAEVVAAYQHTIRVSPQPEPAAPPPEPHAIQQEVLRCLRRTREEGFARGLVVMATGLGKTFLAAFDFLHHGGRRALFVAHREEILRQAADAWARVLPDRSIGFLTGGEKTPDAEILFASIFTIARDQHLRDFSPEHFDYVVVDEFHHAAATSYRRLLAHFRPRFMLGLTATPDRADGAALLELCDDNLVTRVGLVEGIERGLLVPFHYFGVRDSIDFEAIPWQSGRFDPGALDAAVVTRESAAQALREYLRHAPAPRRSLIFCCSVPHADHIAAYFREQGIAAVAVHSRGTSAPRAACLERLRRGEIEAIVAVDVFNEGVDLPDVNTILMLRPTESPVVFLQQLGRGLRRGKDLRKPHLRVIDFIGNHRAFLARPQALLALTGQEVAPGEALRRLRAGALELPPGCSVDVETEALDLLDKVSRISSEDALIYAYRQIRDANGRRPTARELLGAGITKQAVRKRFGTWFDFVAAMNDLRDDEKRVLGEHRPWFRDLSETAMSRSYKMVALQVLDDLDALHGSIEIAALAERCRDRMRRDPLLRADLSEHEAAGGALADFVARWRQMPLMVFHEAKGFSRRWFAVEGVRVVSKLDVAPGDRPTFDAMTAELVDLRLREYLQRERNYAATILPFVAPIELAVGHGGRNPVLQLDRRRRADIPEGDIEVEVDGESRTLRFEASAV
ncbi:MAG TPA: DEAD/DEAH box helicase family protein, partial [Nannocystaceae bacterium]|nr:DEAD/DEAH box helicase family protein [Nannocystaceae bacterium]